MAAHLQGARWGRLTPGRAWPPPCGPRRASLGPPVEGLLWIAAGTQAPPPPLDRHSTIPPDGPVASVCGHAPAVSAAVAACAPRRGWACVDAWWAASPSRDPGGPELQSLRAQRVSFTRSRLAPFRRPCTPWLPLIRRHVPNALPRALAPAATPAARCARAPDRRGGAWPRPGISRWCSRLGGAPRVGDRATLEVQGWNCLGRTVVPFFFFASLSLLSLLVLGSHCVVLFLMECTLCPTRFSYAFHSLAGGHP